MTEEREEPVIPLDTDSGHLHLEVAEFSDINPGREGDLERDLRKLIHLAEDLGFRGQKYIEDKSREKSEESGREVKVTGFSFERGPNKPMGSITPTPTGYIMTYKDSHGRNYRFEARDTEEKK